MNKLTEQELLRSAYNFDQAALAEIYDQYSPGIYRYAMRLLGDVSIAEDCVAETFSRLLKGFQRRQGPKDHLQAYIYRIAHNWVIDTYRRQPPPANELNEQEEDRNQLMPNGHFEQKHEQAVVRQALNCLTPDQRLVIILRFYEGLDNEMVSEVLKKPVGAVKALQHRALSSLRKILLPEISLRNEYEQKS